MLFGESPSTASSDHAEKGSGVPCGRGLFEGTLPRERTSQLAVSRIAAVGLDGQTVATVGKPRGAATDMLERDREARPSDSTGKSVFQIGSEGRSGCKVGRLGIWESVSTKPLEKMYGAIWINAHVGGPHV